MNKLRRQRRDVMLLAVEITVFACGVSILLYTVAMLNGGSGGVGYRAALVTTYALALAYYWPSMRSQRALMKRGIYTFVMMRFPLAITGPVLLSALAGGIEIIAPIDRTIFAVLLIAWVMVVGIHIKGDLHDASGEGDGSAAPQRDGELGP